MNIKINFISVLLFVLAIVVFAGALNDLKYYEFEYFNLQELVISGLILLAFVGLGIVTSELVKSWDSIQKLSDKDEEEIKNIT